MKRIDNESRKKYTQFGKSSALNGARLEDILAKWRNIRAMVRVYQPKRGVNQPK